MAGGHPAVGGLLQVRFCCPLLFTRQRPMWRGRALRMHVSVRRTERPGARVRAYRLCTSGRACLHQRQPRQPRPLVGVDASGGVCVGPARAARDGEWHGGAPGP
jgi:hypothetical protein